MTKNCLTCAKVMNVKPSKFERTKYCSRECKAKYPKENPPEFWTELSMKVDVNCSFCMSAFKRKPSSIKKRNFCSRSCFHKYFKVNKQNQHLRERIILKCKVCKSSFEVIKSRKSIAKYCSKRCLGLSNGKRGKVQYRKRISVNCYFCGNKFEKKPSTIKNWNFCSESCMAECYSSTGLFAGPNSPTWQGGDISYYGPNWRRQRNLARKRDGYTCQDCGKSEQEYGRELSVHHLIPYRKFDGNWKEANKLSNLICLCESPCHRRRHSRVFLIKEEKHLYLNYFRQ